MNAQVERATEIRYTLNRDIVPIYAELYSELLDVEEELLSRLRAENESSSSDSDSPTEYGNIASNPPPLSQLVYDGPESDAESPEPLKSDADSPEPANSDGEAPTPYLYENVVTNRDRQIILAHSSDEDVQISTKKQPPATQGRGRGRNITFAVRTARGTTSKRYRRRRGSNVQFTQIAIPQPGQELTEAQISEYVANLMAREEAEARAAKAERERRLKADAELVETLTRQAKIIEEENAAKAERERRLKADAEFIGVLTRHGEAIDEARKEVEARKIALRQRLKIYGQRKSEETPKSTEVIREAEIIPPPRSSSYDNLKEEDFEEEQDSVENQPCDTKEDQFYPAAVITRVPSFSDFMTEHTEEDQQAFMDDLYYMIVQEQGQGQPMSDIQDEYQNADARDNAETTSTTPQTLYVYNVADQSTDSETHYIDDGGPVVYGEEMSEWSTDPERSNKEEESD